MGTTKQIKVNGFEMAARDSGSTLHVSAAELSKIAKKIANSIVRGSTCRKSTTGTLDITLPCTATQEQVNAVKAATNWLAGETFDGMTDSPDSIEHVTEEGQRVFFGTDFVFVQKDY